MCLPPVLGVLSSHKKISVKTPTIQKKKRWSLVEGTLHMFRKKQQQKGDPLKDDRNGSESSIQRVVSEDKDGCCWRTINKYNSDYTTLSFIEQK